MKLALDFDTAVARDIVARKAGRAREQRFLKALLALMLPMIATAADALPRATQSAAHGYVLGRFADDVGELPEAARYFDNARRRDPSDLSLTRRAFETAVAAGELKLASSLATRLTATQGGDSTVALVRLAEAIQRGDWAAAEAARSGIADVGYAAVVAPIVEAWTLFGRGRVDQGLAKLDPAAMTGFTRSYVAEARAHMLAAARRYAEAAIAYRDLRVGTGPGVSFLALGEADALEQAGDRDGAMKLLDGFRTDPTLTAARARLAAGRRVGRLASEPADGIAWLCARLATDLSRDKPVPLALVFARVATFVAAPGSAASSAAWLITGDVLARSERGSAALAAYDRISANDPLIGLARARRAEVLSTTGRDAEARALLEAATVAPGADVEAWSRLGDWFRKADAHADAARAYTRAIALAEAAPGPRNWTLYFLRGSSHEQAGDWKAAEPDLRRALALAPSEPTVLNYLGYALLDRGLTLDAAQALITRASALRPDDGFITDSLGWAQYRRGQYQAAVTTLERATAAEPGDPTINEHLGDAYWRAGRRIEARFRWRAAYDLGTVATAKAAVAAKLDFGLDAALSIAKQGDAAWLSNTRPQN